MRTSPLRHDFAVLKSNARKQYTSSHLFLFLLSWGCFPALWAGCCRQDSDCDNGLFCDGKELCLNLFCQSGEPPDCNDGVGCTDDKCDETVDSCVSVPNNTLCVDSYFCTVNERCDPVLDCIKDPKDCSDSVACTQDECDETHDICTHEPDHAFCADDSFCNGDELCDPAAGDPDTGCTDSPSPRDCSDGIECTVDACDEDADACTHQPDDVVCQDGIFCNGMEICDPALNPDSGCVDGDDPVCDDGIGCTFDFCDADTDACASTPDDSLCDDDNPCTRNICTPGLGCEHPPEPDGTPCPPHDGTTLCVDGVCIVRTCGDGYVEPLDSEAPAEECDDGNTDDTDGCTSLCRSQDFQTNTTEAGEEKNPSAAVLDDGGFVIVFEDETYSSPSYTDVRLRRYDHFGNSAGGSDELLSEGGSGIQIQPAAAPLPGGGFASAWADNAGSGDLFDVKLRLFSSSGTGSHAIQVNTSLFGSQLAPFVTASTGGILVLWEDQATLSGEIKLRRFDLSGHTVDATERALPTGAMMYMGEPTAAISPDGSFLAVWTGSSDGTSTAVYGSIFDEAAVPVSEVIEISSSVCHQNYSPSIAWYGDPGSGVFTIVWERICSGSYYPEVAAVVVDPADLTAAPEPLTISPTTEESFSPIVTAARLLAIPGGSSDPPAWQWIAVFIWAGTSTSTESTDAPYDIFGQRYIVEGDALAPFDPDPVVLTTIDRFEQNDPAGAMNLSGDLAITWTDYSQEGSDASYSSVRARYLPNGWLIE